MCFVLFPLMSIMTFTWYDICVNIFEITITVCSDRQQISSTNIYHSCVNKLHCEKKNKKNSTTSSIPNIENKSRITVKNAVMVVFVVVER